MTLLRSTVRVLVAALTLVVASAHPAPPAHAGTGGEPAPDSVGLTFDDGPDPRWTPVILDILDEYEVTATFFVVGWKVREYPELAREIVERGHSIQLHGDLHNKFWNLSDTGIEQSLLSNANAIFDATGVYATCFRPPYGATNSRVRGVVEGFGVDHVLWDFDTRDHSIQTTSGVLRRTLTVEAGQNVVMHDTWGSIWQHILPTVLEEFQARGYLFDTVCENRYPVLPRLHWKLSVFAY